MFQLAENCLAQHHVAIVEDQLEQIIEVFSSCSLCSFVTILLAAFQLVNSGVSRVVGTKLTTVVETQTTTTTSTHNLSSGPPTARVC